MREVVAAGGRGSPDAGERPGVQLQGIANVVESDAVSQLRVKQADDVAPRCEGPGFFIRLGLMRDLGNKKLGNEIANLPQKIQF